MLLRYNTPVMALLLLATAVGLVGPEFAQGQSLVVLDNLHWTASFAATAWMGAVGWQRETDPAMRLLRKWATFGAVSLLVGQLIWVGMAWASWYPVPNPADPAFLAVGPLLAVGFWRMGATRLPPAEWRATQLDAAALLVGTQAVALAVFLPQQGDASLLQVLTLSAYPLGLMAPLSLALILLLKLRARMTWRALLLPAMAATFMVCWGLWNLQLMTATTVDGAYLNRAFSVAAFGLGWGIQCHRFDGADEPRRDRIYEGILRMLPLLMVLAASAGVTLSLSTDAAPWSSRVSVQVGSVVIVIMAFARQMVLLEDRGRLLVAERLLKQRESELEARVAARTAELSRAREAAEAASQAKSEFLANMSHEIRTPLNGVLGFAQLAMLSAREPNQRAYMAKIEQSGKQLLRLINDILDMSKIEAGKVSLERIRFDLGGVFDAVQGQFVDQAQAKGLALNFVVAPQARLALLGDPLRLTQIVTNYLGNAIKFTERGRIDVHASLTHEDDASVLLKVSVRDSGVGMSEGTLSRLFCAFEQADNSTTRRFGGTGLGLAICQHLAKMMGGEVGGDSVLGQGSCFWFTARLDKALRLVHDAGAEGGAAAAPVGALRAGGGRILLADDNELNRLLACSILEQNGYTVRTAQNGVEALALLRHEPFDCVLMDMQMPGMDGLMATRRIRQEGAHARLPIIALTANARAEDEAACREAGMNDFVSKPFDVKLMLATVARWSRAGAALGSAGGGDAAAGL